MYKFCLLICLIFGLNAGYSQTYQRVVYTVSHISGNPDILYSAGEIRASFRFDSVGANWNMPTENEYMRFKILHFYVLNERKGGEHWKKLYIKEKNRLNETFDKYMKSRLKRKNYKISTDYENTKYRLDIIFFDASDNVQYSNYEAICQFIDEYNGRIVLQYRFKVKTKGYTGTPTGLAIAMSNYFKKYH